jgi:hypothetical protein
VTHINVVDVEFVEFYYILSANAQYILTMICFYSTSTCFDVYTSSSKVSNKVTKLIKWESLYKLLLKRINRLKSLKTS